jgi:hypothetical protein
VRDDHLDSFLGATADEVLTKAANPMDDLGRLYDTARVDYDPDKMALFNDILFSRGFE